MEPAEFFMRLVDDWHQSERPLFIVDEVRIEDPMHREITAFIFCCTNTRRAVEWADRASKLRQQMPLQSRDALIKGADLYGGRSRPIHGAFRRYVDDAVHACDAVARVVTTSPTITKYKELAPGGIRRPSDEAGTSLSPIRGRELVPFMNMLKVVAMERAFGEVQADVLVDRSAQLGLVPSRLGVSQDDVIVMGPSTLNEAADGSRAELQCPTAFRFIATSEESAFRDLLLLPDSVGYAIRSTLGQLAPRLGNTDFHRDYLDLVTFTMPNVAV